MKRLLLLTLGLTMICGAKAQEEKLEIKPSGRILLDGGLLKPTDRMINLMMDLLFPICEWASVHRMVRGKQRWIWDMHMER